MIEEKALCKEVIAFEGDWEVWVSFECQLEKGHEGDHMEAHYLEVNTRDSNKVKMSEYKITWHNTEPMDYTEKLAYYHKRAMEDKKQ